MVNENTMGLGHRIKFVTAKVKSDSTIIGDTRSDGLASFSLVTNVDWINSAQFPLKFIR